MPLVYDAVTGTWKVQAGGGGAPTPPINTSYDAALSAMRSAGASDGDYYLTSSGLSLQAYTSVGPGILIPSNLYPSVGGYLGTSYDVVYDTGYVSSFTDTASGVTATKAGESWFTKSDTDAQIIARGWQPNLTGSGTLNRTGGGSTGILEFVSGTASSSRSYLYINLVDPSPMNGMMAIFKAQAVSTGVNPLNNQGYMPYFAIAATVSTPNMPYMIVSPFTYSGSPPNTQNIGGWNVYASSTTVNTQQKGYVNSDQVSPRAEWYVAYLNTSNTSNWANESGTFRKMDMLGDLGTGDTGQFSTTISGLPTRTGTNSTMFIGVNRFSGSASAKIEVTEMHVFRVV